jgi:hypothetical protein
MTQRYLGAGQDLGGQKITNLADGSSAADAATWGQVQAYIRGLKYKWARARATTNLTLSGTQTVDGVALVAGDRVLADAQTTATQDGVYIVASGAWARADDFAVGFDAAGVAVTITEGTANGDKLYVQTAEPAIVGTDGLTFGPLGGGITYTADGNGIELSGTTFALELDGTTLAKSSAGLRVGSGAAGAGLTEASGVLAVGAGTGVTVAADTVSVDTGVVARWFSNGGTHSAGTTVSLTHNLGRKSYTVSVAIAATGEEVLADVVKGDNSVTVTFGASQSVNTILLTVVG